MKIQHLGKKFSSTWYSKATDTGLTMSFHALAPTKYKRSVVVRMVHQIHHTCSTWKNFHESLEKAKVMLRKNQYPPPFYEPVIKRTLTKIYSQQKLATDKDPEEERVKKMVFVPYRGKVTENFEKALNRIKAPCKIVTTIRKLKTVLPFLKNTNALVLLWEIISMRAAHI